MDKLEHAQIETNGIRLHVVQAGSADGELVILLHGFPEFWYGWRRQISALAEAGYRVWAPDQRGYNLSDKPGGVGAYKIDALSADVVGLIEAAGRERAAVIGHDWGAAAAWWTAGRFPERVSRLGILNVPHGSVMAKHLRSSLSQLRKSWYMLFFQIPWLPELILRRDEWGTMIRALKGTSRPGTFSAADLALYREAWSQPGAMTAMLNWYRAVSRRVPSMGHTAKITVPTLMIWGAQDRFLDQEMAQASIERCEDGRLVMIEEASHWVQHEEAERVNGLLLDFLGS